MSRDSYIYLESETFPDEEWGAILSSFKAENRDKNCWVVSSVDGPVWIRCDKLTASENHSDTYEWKITINWQATYEVNKLWLAYVIPYHCLALMNNAVYFCPQQEIFINAARDYEDFANSEILKYTSLQKLYKNGLLNGYELLKLDT